MNTSIGISNITLQWEPVDCVHRNGHVNSYSVSYMLDDVLISKTTTNLMFNITGLQPRTKYTISVWAVGVEESISKSQILTETLTPQGSLILLVLM